jgi:hypothetical protein
MILVLGTGCRFLLANQQLNKLKIDSGSLNAVQTIFTLWTDELAMQSAKPSSR